MYIDLLIHHQDLDTEHNTEMYGWTVKTPHSRPLILRKFYHICLLTPSNEPMVSKKKIKFLINEAYKTMNEMLTELENQRSHLEKLVKQTNSFQNMTFKKMMRFLI